MAVLGETNTSNNLSVGGQVLVFIPGDVGGDCTANILDAIVLGNSFPPTSCSVSWNPNAEVNCDGVVDI